MRRSAFTFIELIFAIVIVAITVLSLPVMNQVLSKGTDSALVQEAIFAAATELNQATTYRWDENSLESKTDFSRVLRVDGADCSVGNNLRTGHINQPFHRRCTDDATLRPSASLGKEAGDLDDLDDTIKSASSMYHNSSGKTVTTSAGYKKALNTAIAVNYAAFGDIPASEKNIKKITVTVSNTDGTVALLSTYSANIGEVEYYHRRYN